LFSNILPSEVAVAYASDDYTEDVDDEEYDEDTNTEYDESEIGSQSGWLTWKLLANTAKMLD
jgi:hypothetical protein